MSADHAIAMAVAKLKATSAVTDLVPAGQIWARRAPQKRTPQYPYIVVLPVDEEYFDSFAVNERASEHVLRVGLYGQDEADADAQNHTSAVEKIREALHEKTPVANVGGWAGNSTFRYLGTPFDDRIEAIRVTAQEFSILLTKTIT